MFGPPQPGSPLIDYRIQEWISPEDFDSLIKPFITGTYRHLEGFLPYLPLVEVSSSALGASVLSCSDDFFASKDNLIKPNVSLLCL